LAQAAPGSGHGPLADIAFLQVTQDRGLPNSIASALAEDGHGFLWIGGPAGLSRWDGYRFPVCQADPQRDGALTDKCAQALHGDAGGRPWADAAGLRVSRVALAGRNPAVSVWALLADDDLWTGGQSDGLWRLDLRRGRAEAFSLAAPGLSDQRVTVLARAPAKPACRGLAPAMA
jgi:ligand-binding sensor domain-containing protein